MNKKEFINEIEKMLYTVASYMEPDMRIKEPKGSSESKGDDHDGNRSN